ncbi:MAG TPA: phosphate signaling complex protein PhoU, partial [Limnochordia bacterium]|nr:phosphate signaling complex protein PhoU [Limnochordia bacterium]
MERTRQAYDTKLRALHAQLLKMSSLVEQLIDDAVTSLAQLDLRLAERVIAGDDQIDALEVEIEEACTRLIALQQPLARDLRGLATTYRLVNDLERMGDYSVNIAKVTKKIAPEGLIKPLVDIPRMARMVQRMVHDALDAFVRGDLGLSEQVCARDRAVDELNAELFA